VASFPNLFWCVSPDEHVVARTLSNMAAATTTSAAADVDADTAVVAAAVRAVAATTTTTGGSEARTANGLVPATKPPPLMPQISDASSTVEASLQA
jgi:hypothetical protein